MEKQKVTLREMQSLFGCSIIVPGRAFLRRLIDLTMGDSRSLYHTKLTRQVKLDLLIRQDFLADFNGKAFFLNENFMTGDYLQLFIDASGYGAVCGPKSFFGRWSSSWLTLNITVLESNCSSCGVMGCFMG